MLEISPSEHPLNVIAMPHAKIEASFDGPSPLRSQLTRRQQSLLAINALAFWILALAALLFALVFYSYGWDRRSSVGLPNIEVRVTLPHAPTELGVQRTELMNTVVNLGAAAYGVAILLSLLGLLLATVALLVPKRRRGMAVTALTLNFLLLYFMTVMVPG